MSELPYHLTPNQAAHFLRKLCLVSIRYRQRQSAKLNLHAHIKDLKKHSKKQEYHKDLDKLQNKINNYVLSEKKIRFQERQSVRANEDLLATLSQLQKQLTVETEEKEKALGENRDKINELAEEILSIKDQISHIAKIYKKRQKRQHSLEKKIEQKLERKK